jgi:hypothetical protein
MGTGGEMRELQIGFRFGDLKFAPQIFPCGSWDHFGERGSVNYENDIQDYAKNGKAGLWIVVGNAPT